MRKAIFIGAWLILVFAGAPSRSQNVPVKQVTDVPKDFCITGQEWKLYRMINEYRRQYDLPPVPLSVSLCFVARTHVKDLLLNHPDQDPCNLHSWSDKGPWKPFCYPADENKKGSVWDKPKELSKYPGKAYEIVYWENDTVNIDSVISFWKSIEYFNSFLMSNGKWSGKRWNAIGIGIYLNYAVAWFGEAPDPEGIPRICGKEPLPAVVTADSAPEPKPGSGQEVKPEPKPAPPAPVAQQPGKYYIVVKSQLPPEESDKLAASLRSQGYAEAKVIRNNDKIRVVMFEALNREQANGKLAEARKLYKDAWILVP